MRIETIIHFDLETINQDKVNSIISSNENLKQIECEYYQGVFDHTVFCHALLLLGTNSNRFGYDLTHYLEAVNLYLRKLNINNFIILDIGSPDFKRMTSEDFGVAISSLFMVETFKVLWETISQISLNKKLSRFTPDFMGFDRSEKRFIYESKGTTSSQNVEKALHKAIQQAKSYPESAEEKLAIVSYFPSDRKTFPSFTFIADPPIRNIFEPDRWHSVMLLYIKVLEYAGLDNTREKFVDLLRLKLRLEEKYPDNQ